ncbi:NB-ARC domain, LRR domain containing protein, partial [Trema orientale]
EPHVLQEELRKTLKKEKFLFVLDDIWDEDPHKWDVLKSSFKSGLYGSTILVTTRSRNVASIMNTVLTHQLSQISNDEGWRLFTKHALIDDVGCSDLQVIGRKIVDKCNGLPLAIKSLGILLRNKRNKEEWDNILNDDMWELYEKRSISILPALWLSYYHLPSHLKPCFAYCAMFPKDYKFVKEKIVLLWMAEGLLHPRNGKRMEEVGEEYFQDLTSRSFFQPSSNKDELALVMHDLVHDLAIFVSIEFCLEMDDTKDGNCAHKIRHLSYRVKGIGPKKFEGLSKAKGLRTFFLTESCKSNIWSLQMEHLLGSLVHTGGCLRVLSVSGSGMTTLPDSIGDLKYLKYLDLSHTRIEELSDAICRLYNLQTLLLENCYKLTQLPRNIGNLVNLRCLQIPDSLREMPLQIGKMKNLQALNNFIVGKNSESGIKLLKELQDLHGTLEIWGLENVADVKDILEVELRNKKFLSEISLYFSGCLAPDDSQKKREILGALKPHADSKILTINNYRGTSFPDWVGDHLYSNLQQVRLCNCNNCCLLPSLGQLRYLKSLTIWGLPGVVSIGSEFYHSNDVVGSPKPFRSLETLHFQDMSNLQEWLFIQVEVEEGGAFPCLRRLTLKNCPRLKVSLPDFLPSLRELFIERCESLVAPLVLSAQQMDIAFPSLEILHVHHCGGQDYLLKGGLPWRLKEIRIESCHKLEALDEEAFQHLTSLDKLVISQCDKLRCLPRALPTSLSLFSANSMNSITISSPRN